MKTSVHLLLADDNRDELFFITRAIEGAGYDARLETVFDGVQVIEHLSQHQDSPPDALILDLNMPRKSGFDVLEWLKTHQGGFPVIVHTSTDDPVEEAKAIQLGADAFVVKEVSYRPLITKLTEILNPPAG